MYPPEVPSSETLDPAALVLGAAGPVFIIVWALVLAAAASWVVIVVKWRQTQRWLGAEAQLAQQLKGVRDPAELERLAAGSEALGADLLRELVATRDEPELLDSTTAKALGAVEIRASQLMTLLSSVGAVAPFVGLLGTVYGIMDAFLRIGRENSASLPVVAPAIGEALIVTAIGLFAAIPAVLGYNFLGRRIDDLLAGLKGSAGVWAEILRHAPGTRRN